MPEECTIHPLIFGILATQKLVSTPYVWPWRQLQCLTVELHQPMLLTGEYRAMLQDWLLA